MHQTQQNKILELLQDRGWHCVNEFINTYCVDYRRRLVDLKEKGYQLISRKCLRHTHHGGSKEWRLVSEPSQLENPSNRLLNDIKENQNYMNNQPLFIRCCVWNGRNGLHASNCQVEIKEVKENALW